MEEKLKQQPANIVKVVLFGPESTGKSTLSELLARHYNTVWVPEYAREYLQDKWNNQRKTCEQKDLIPIAIGQMGLENELAKKADKILICDTDLLETKVYSEEYYGGFVDPDLDRAVTESQYELYLLSYIDTPWEADDLRDRPTQREEMFRAFERALVNNQRPYVILKGKVKERMNTAVQAIDRILASKANLDAYSDKLTH
jgi:NadR type nicotinamide-nucleotide adenylyltransferase